MAFKSTSVPANSSYWFWNFLQEFMSGAESVFGCNPHISAKNTSYSDPQCDGKVATYLICKNGWCWADFWPADSICGGLSFNHHGVLQLGHRTYKLSWNSKEYKRLCKYHHVTNPSIWQVLTCKVKPWNSIIFLPAKQALHSVISLTDWLTDWLLDC